MLIKKYNDELDDVINKLNSIKGFNFDSVNVYGSAVNEDMFTQGVSDIDIIVMSKDFNKFDKNSIINQINEMNIDFKEKRPIIIKDNLCERIEFYVVYKNINIDVTLCSGLIPSRNSLEKDAWYDGFESLMGGVYMNSYSLYGKIPDYDIFKANYYPFYDDDLRNTRLDVLSKRLITYNERIDRYLKNDSPEMVDHVFKVKKYFLKFLYIYNRTYFWTPEKHTYYQLTKFLNLDEEEKRILCFMDGTFKEAARKYIDYTSKCIDDYEKVKVKR